MSPPLSFEIKGKQRSNDLGVANVVVLNEVGVYHERVYADKVVSKFWFVRSFFSQRFSKLFTNITSENVSMCPDPY